MEKYQSTNMWKNTLGSECQENQAAINRLKQTFISFREKASILANEIHRVLPEYTNHDISHIDALWELADCICGNNYKINPVEGFILGGAFLLHDLAMSLAAYPNGISDLESLPLWADTIAHRCKSKNVPLPSSILYKDLPENIRAYVVSTILRKLHSNSATKLATTAWKGVSSNDCIFLIDDPEIRQNFGRIIGKIASSHWWDIFKLEQEFSRTVGAPNWCPSTWTIDPLKIACILRVADASHIDSRRAPQFLRILRKLDNKSDEHWCFQEKLQKPYLSEDSLFFTSGNPFKTTEASSWWLCYETLVLIDKELRQTDALLADNSMNRFQAKRVFGIESPERLSTLILCEDWSPINAFIHIGDLPKIIKTLGGEELYGNDLTIPIRELIQNSTDAIRARRKLEGRSEEWGKIRINRWIEGNNNYIQIEDTGIGMSLEVVKNYLFDFGKSYWGSELMLEEHPGLMAKNINVTGKYGIGFFSVFMLCENILIITRKCTSAQDDTHAIEFKNGINTRPIIRKASPAEYLIDGGTRITIQLQSKDIVEKLFNTKKGSRISLKDICLSIAPALDVLLEIRENDNETIIPVDNWKKCSSSEFIKILQVFTRYEPLEENEDISSFLEKAASNLREIHNQNGEIVGRGFLGVTLMESVKEAPSLRGCVAVGGLVESHVSGICGILCGTNNNAARNDTTILANEKIMAAWVSEQAKLVKNLYKPKYLQSVAQIVRILKGDPNDLPIAIYDGKDVNYHQLKEIINNKQKMILVDDFFLDYKAEDFDALIYDSDLLFASISGVPSIFHKKQHESWGFEDSDNWNFDKTNAGYICEIISDSWKIPIIETINVIKWQNKEKVKIAENNGKPIMESAFIFDRNNLQKNIYKKAPQSTDK